MSTDDIVKLAEQGILACIVLVLLAVAIKGTWQGGRWLGTQIFLPVKIAFLEHLDKIGKILESIQKTNQEEQGERHQMLQTLSEHTKAIQRIDKNVEDLRRDARGFFREAHEEHEERHNEKD